MKARDIIDRIMESNIPEGWTQIDVRKVFTAEQLRVILAIIDRNESSVATRKLKEYLGRYEKELAAKGMVVDYLAYALPYFLKTKPREENPSAGSSSIWN